jgi:hypothetical protein
MDDCQLALINRQSALGNRKFSSHSFCGGTGILPVSVHSQDGRAITK